MVDADTQAEHDTVGTGAGGATNFVVVGAGAVGAYVGVTLAAKRHRVSFLVRRPRQAERLSVLGLSASCSAEPTFQRAIPPYRMNVGTDASVLQRCGCILVCTKRTANAAIARLLVDGAVTAPTLLLQNGLGAADDVFRAAQALAPASRLPPLADCVVNFSATFHEAECHVSLDESREAAILLVDGSCGFTDALCAAMGSCDLSVVATSPLLDYQAGKLLVNMGNAVRGPIRLVVHFHISISYACAAMSSRNLGVVAASPLLDHQAGNLFVSMGNVYTHVCGVGVLVRVRVRACVCVRARKPDIYIHTLMNTNVYTSDGARLDSRAAGTWAHTLSIAFA